MEESIADRSAAVAGLQRGLQANPKRNRAQRRVLNSEIAATRKHLASISAQRKFLDKVYRDAGVRALLRDEQAAVAELARDFSGQSYDLSDADSRRRLKMRMLSFIRPQARDQLLEIARRYAEKFNRPLPVTSLVRTEQYQKRLSEWNHNAARNSAPPHVTGLAFDVYYHFMTAAEQDYLMSIIATLKSEGRVEALRETRDHIHVFAFTDGQRPDESLVSRAISESKTTKYSARAATKRRTRRNT